MFGAALVEGLQRQKALVVVLSWTWHSIPITGRKPLLARRALSTAGSLAVITRCSIVHAFAAIGNRKRRSKLMLRGAAAAFKAFMCFCCSFFFALVCYCSLGIIEISKKKHRERCRFASQLAKQNSLTGASDKPSTYVIERTTPRS